MSAPRLNFPYSGGGGGGGISGSGTAGYVAKFTSGTAVGDSVMVELGSAIGIDCNPDYINAKLDVNGNIIGRYNLTIGSSSLLTASNITSALSTDLVLQRAGVEAARIIAGGKIGIGNTDPATLLETYGTSGIRASSDTIANIGVFQYSSDATPATLALRKARGTRAAQTTIATSDQLGSVNFAAYGGTSGSTLSSISSYCEAYVGNADMSASLRFGVSPAGSVTATETMRIMPGTAAIPIGNVGIGTTTPGTKLDVAYGDYQTIGAMRIGADIGTLSTRSNNNPKFGAITVPHYTNSEENIFLQGIHSLSNSTICFIGGGLNGFNASTSTRFYAAANNTTQAGTYIAQLTTSGISLDTSTSTLIFDAQTTGQGIRLPSTPGNGQANTLDCYVEANWSPADASGAGMTLTQTGGVVARYTQIGRQVVCFCDITYPATILSGASAAAISLPVAASGAQGGHFIGGGSTALWGIVSGANLLLYNFNTLTATTNTTLGASRRLIFTLSYFVN